MGEPNQIRDWQRAAADPHNALRQAQEEIFVAMGGRGNLPYICLANAVDNAHRALELGLPVDDLDCMLPAGRLPAEERILAAYRAVATAVEGEAIRRWRGELVTA